MSRSEGKPYIEYPSPEVLTLYGQKPVTIGVMWWAATERNPEHYTLGWPAMSGEQVRRFARQLLAMVDEREAAARAPGSSGRPEELPLCDAAVEAEAEADAAQVRARFLGPPPRLVPD